MSGVRRFAAQIADGKILVGIKAGVGYSLIDNGTQGTVNAQVQFGTGTRYCMRCTGNKKDEAEAAAKKAETNPAKPDDVKNSDTADLNHDGFVTLDEVVALEKAGLKDRDCGGCSVFAALFARRHHRRGR